MAANSGHTLINILEVKPLFTDLPGFFPHVTEVKSLSASAAVFLCAFTTSGSPEDF